MSRINKKKCITQVSHGFYVHRCTRNVWQDDFCKQHHPDTIKVKTEESIRKYEEKRKESPSYQLEKLQEQMKRRDFQMLKIISTLEIARTAVEIAAGSENKNFIGFALTLDRINDTLAEVSKPT